MASGPLSLPAVSLGGLAIESFMFGNFFILSIATMGLLAYREKHLSGRRSFSVAKNPIFIGSMMMVMFVTGHWVCTVKRSFEAFLYLHEGSIELYYAKGGLPANLAKDTFLTLALFTTDTMMIYRLWIIWGKNRWIVILPIVLILGYIADSIVLSIQLSHAHDVLQQNMVPWMRANIVSTLAINLYCTSLIVWQIWTTNHRTSSFSSSNLNAVIAQIVESAALYTMSTVLYLILVEVRSTVQFVFLDLWPLFAGISFMLINVRAALGWAASQSSNRDEHMSTWRFSPPTPHQETPSHVVGPLVVNISRAEDRSHEFEMDAIPRRADDKYLYDGEAERTSSC